MNIQFLIIPLLSCIVLYCAVDSMPLPNENALSASRPAKLEIPISNTTVESAIAMSRAVWGLWKNPASPPLTRDFLRICWGIFGKIGQILRFLIKITWFLSFSNKNDAESLCHFVKIPFFDPKRVKLDQNSDFCHVRTYSWLHKSEFGHVRTFSWLHKLRNTQGEIHGWQWNVSRKYIYMEYIRNV